MIIIKIYWRIIPVNLRRNCLFKETCSHYVYRNTIEGGFFKGINALRERLKKCKKGYQLYTVAQGFELELADGSVIKEEEISSNLLDPINEKIKMI